jgi:hypothetical protein
MLSVKLYYVVIYYILCFTTEKQRGKRKTPTFLKTEPKYYKSGRTCDRCMDRTVQVKRGFKS